MRTLDETRAERDRWKERATDAASGVVRLSREVGFLTAEKQQLQDRVVELEQLAARHARGFVRDIMFVNPRLSSRVAKARLQ